MARPGFLDGFKTVFTTPTALMLTIGFSCFIFVITGYMTWVPAYLQEEFGQSQAAAGFNSMFYTYVAAFARPGSGMSRTGCPDSVSKRRGRPAQEHRQRIQS